MKESNNRFELAAKFINSVKQAEIIALQENPEQGRDFLKKIGSNFRLSGQKLFLDFKNPFKILAEAEPRLWRGEATIAQNPNSENWRKGWDLNPRAAFIRPQISNLLLWTAQPPFLAVCLEVEPPNITVRPPGFEPGTVRLRGGWCYQLSYGRVINFENLRWG